MTPGVITTGVPKGCPQELRTGLPRVCRQGSSQWGCPKGVANVGTL
jgi:hypothetical protein